MDTLNFYKQLEPIDSFSKITQEGYYQELPSSWYIIVSDIKNSTKAIENGKYKEVNFVASLVIIGILNLDREIELPIIFGGDGASILIPPILIEKAKDVLFDAKKKAKEKFFLDLRIGIVPYKDIKKENKPILVAKYSSSKEHTQTLINGGGLSYAEKLLKEENSKYILKGTNNSNKEIDFNGLECRWQDIPSPKEETLCLLIESTKKDLESYVQIISTIEKIAGESTQRHPIKYINNIKLSFNPKTLNTEASVFSKGFLKKVLQIFKITIENLIGLFLMKKGVSQWGYYKNRILDTTDTEKFDDMLRMVISTNKEQTKKLQEYLEEKYRKKELIYGLHISNSALMTCLIFERHGKHIHFVDGSNGGYALAAKQMKSL